MIGSRYRQVLERAKHSGSALDYGRQGFNLVYWSSLWGLVLSSVKCPKDFFPDYIEDWIRYYMKCFMEEGTVALPA